MASDIDPSQDSYERRFGNALSGPKDADITQGREFIEQKRAEEKAAAESAKLDEALRNAAPSILKSGEPIFGGRSPMFQRTDDEPRRTDFSVGTVTGTPQRPPFPADTSESITQVSSGVGMNCSFLMKNATVTVAGVTTFKVLILDGKINGTFPSGMGFGNYKLTVPTQATYMILAGVTFNPTTLLETSRFLEIDLPAAVPESRVESATAGFLYWQIGFVYFTAGKMIIWQTWLGDINFAFSYGAYNGKPALLPIHSNPGWLDLDGMFP